MISTPRNLLKVSSIGICSVICGVADVWGCCLGLQARGTLPPEVLDTQVDPAAFELSGHLVLKRAADFEAVSEDSCWRLLECASLDEVRAAQPKGV